MKRWIWMLWFLTLTMLASYYSYRLFASEHKGAFLIGTATHGHHQIELACSSCHTSPFGGSELLQEACESCHGVELKAAHDSHPKSKFTDPRNADRLVHLDARACVACHREHKLEQTRAMGVTLPDDFCFHCHQDIAAERPSHEGMGFDTCASAGCHNYHDNRALYEDFLVKNADQPFVHAVARVTAKAPAEAKHPPERLQAALRAEDADAPVAKQEKRLLATWQEDVHGQAGVNCSGCHQAQTTWVDRPQLDVCADCHGEEAASFMQGKHGMRLDPRLQPPLTPMMPALGRLPFKPGSADEELTCNSCHGAHDFDVQRAAVESCLNCHSDEHSLAYPTSPHAQLWQAELKDEAAPGTGVTCATCHLPREVVAVDGHERVRVTHNQNHNLRPNEKMIRAVCMDCHSLAFALDALADPLLIRSNFSGRPSQHVQSLDMALERSRQQDSATHNTTQP